MVTLEATLACKALKERLARLGEVTSALLQPSLQEADPVWAYEEPHPETTEVSSSSVSGGTEPPCPPLHGLPQL